MIQDRGDLSHRQATGNIKIPSRAYSLGKTMDKMIFKDGSRHIPTATGKECECRRSHDKSAHFFSFANRSLYGFHQSLQ